jgi:hypothetical protein
MIFNILIEKQQISAIKPLIFAVFLFFLYNEEWDTSMKSNLPGVILF